MATAAPKSAKKSRRKSRHAPVVQKHGGALIPGAGRGPKRGAPNAGRPPDEIRAALRLQFDKRVKVLTSIADNKAEESSVRIKAVEMLARYGLGTTWTPTNTAGENLQLPQVVVN